MSITTFSLRGPFMDRVVSTRFPTAQTRVLFQDNNCWICGRQIGSGTGISQGFSNISPMLSKHFIIRLSPTTHNVINWHIR